MKKTFFIALALAGFAAVGLSNSSETHASTINVKNGDTLWGYSQKYDVSIDSIAKANGFEMNKFMMWPGDKINIPDGKANEAGAKFNNHFSAGNVVNHTATVKPIVKAQLPKKATASTNTYTTNSRANTQTNTRTNTQTSAQSAGTFKISFYDPAVLGASTMPGGLYSGVAANLSVFPKGTRLRISMSNGQVLYRTVNDTGAFAYSNSHQLDVAMPNSAVPAAGILSATVSVIK